MPFVILGGGGRDQEDKEKKKFAIFRSIELTFCTHSHTYSVIACLNLYEKNRVGAHEPQDRLNFLEIFKNLFFVRSKFAHTF